MIFCLWNSKMKNQIKTKLYYPNQEIYKIRLRTFSVIEKYVNNNLLYTKFLIKHYSRRLLCRPAARFPPPRRETLFCWRWSSAGCGVGVDWLGPPGVVCWLASGVLCWPPVGVRTSGVGVWTSAVGVCWLWDDGACCELCGNWDMNELRLRPGTWLCIVSANAARVDANTSCETYPGCDVPASEP